MKGQQATLTIGGKTFTTGDLVTTPMGDGYIIGIDPFGDMEIFVKLHTPKDLGSKFWFTFTEVTVKEAE